MDRNAWIAAIGSLVFSALAQAAPFAMITDLKGSAWVNDGGRPKNLSMLGYVDTPIEVRVEPSAKLSITYFTSGVQYSFDGPARVALDAKEPRVLEGKALQNKVGPDKTIAGGMSNDQWRRLQQATVVMRTVKSSFTVVSPADKTAILASEPEFEWTPAADAKRYRLVVYGPDNQVLHEATTDQTALHPGASLKLQPGQKYRWKVDALGVSKPSSAQGHFEVADDAQRERIAATRPAAGAELPIRVFYATTLDSEGYLTDARAEWKALVKEYPNVPELKQRLERY
ncbi:MAG: hypothetical protein ACRET8_06450 [Burkholderiales bacterium]